MRRLIICFCAAAASLLPLSTSFAQSAPAVHVVSIASGPSGAESNGNFVFKEERAAFNRSEDREVIVMFQWDGPPGPHKMVATWKSPDGGYSSNSTIDYVAKGRRFGAFWTLTIAPSMALGLWSIEATVDGQPAGRYTFEITDSPVAPGPPPKRVLTEQELYDKLSPHYVVLQRQEVAGRDAEPAAGVRIAGDMVLTAIKALDETARIRQVSGDGAARDVTSVLDVSREAGWALLPSNGASPAPLSAADAPKVGDRCFTMQAATTGARLLVEGRIVGHVPARPSAPAHWIASFVNGVGTQGAPVVNQFGELLGVLRGPAAPDIHRLRAASVVDYGNVPIIPVTSAVRRSAAPITFEELRTRGILLEPLTGDEHVVSGGFAMDIPRSARVISPQDQRDEFSRGIKEFVVFVTVSARERVRGQGSFVIFDEANRRVGFSKPSRTNYPKGELVLSSWKIQGLNQTGTYRVELQLDGKPMWRGYVKIVE